MINFPEKIWDGRSATRSNLTDICAPGHEDWCTITREMQATQRYLLDLTDTLETMPNLKQAIEDGRSNIAAYLRKVKDMALPADLKKDVEAVKERIDKLDGISERLDTLIRLVQALQQQLFAHTADYQKFKNNVKKYEQGMENKTRLRMGQFEKTTNERVQELTQRINDISELLSFQQIN